MATTTTNATAITYKTAIVLHENVAGGERYTIWEWQGHTEANKHTVTRV